MRQHDSHRSNERDGGDGRAHRRAPGKGPSHRAHSTRDLPGGTHTGDAPVGALTERGVKPAAGDPDEAYALHLDAADHPVAIDPRWFAITGTLLTDSKTPTCPFQPAAFEWMAYSFLLAMMGEPHAAEQADAVEDALARPGRETYRTAFVAARTAQRSDKPKLSRLRADIALLARGGDVHEAGARIVAHHATLTPHGKRTVAHTDKYGTGALAAYVAGACFTDGALAGGKPAGDARKAACAELLDGLRHGAPSIPSPFALPAAEPVPSSTAPNAPEGELEEARQLERYIEGEIAGAAGKALTRDELDKIENRVRAARPRVRELVLGNRALIDQVLQSVDPTHGQAIFKSLDAVEALYEQCRATMPVLTLLGRHFPKPAGANNQAIALLRPWFLSHPEPMRMRALHHAGLEKEVYAQLPEAQRREVTRLALTGSAQPSPRDEILDAVQAGDGPRTVRALRALAGADLEFLVKLQADAAFTRAIAKLDRPVPVGQQMLVPYQVCREMWGTATATDDVPDEVSSPAGPPLTAVERHLLGVQLFDPVVEQIHGVMNGHAPKENDDPFDFSSAALTTSWGIPDFPARARAIRELLVGMERKAATEPYLSWLRREHMAAGPELEHRLEARHHVTVRAWSEKWAGGDRAGIARVIDAAPDATTNKAELHQVLVLGRTLSERVADDAAALAKAFARKDDKRALGIWQMFRFDATAACAQVAMSPIELMRGAFRVHGDLETRIRAAFVGDALASVLKAFQLDAVAVATTAPTAPDVDNGDGPLIHPDEEDLVSPAFTETAAKASAQAIYDALHHGGRIEVIDVGILSELTPVERRIVLRGFRRLSGHELAEYIRAAQSWRNANAEVIASARKTLGYHLDVQEVAVGGDKVTLHGSDAELERALVVAQGRSLDARDRVRVAASNRSAAQVQRVLEELTADERKVVADDGALMDHVRQHLDQKAWEHALATVTSAPVAKVQAEAPGAQKPDGIAILQAARGNKAILRALVELDFAERTRLQADPSLMAKLLAGLDGASLAQARDILAQRSDAAGGTSDRDEYDAIQAVNRMRIAFGQSWKAVLTQAVAVFQLPLPPTRDLRQRIWHQLAGEIRAYARRQQRPGGVTADAVTEEQIIEVLRDAILGTADPSNALVAASIETVDERHAANARLGEQLGRPMPGFTSVPGLTESSTADEKAIAEALREASPRHIVEHWTSVVHPSVEGRPPMKASYDAFRSAHAAAQNAPTNKSAQAVADRALLAFVQYVIGLTAEFEHMLVPHMGDDRSDTKAGPGPRIHRRDNKRYNALAQIILGRIADVPPQVLADALGMAPDHIRILYVPGPPERLSPNFQAIARGHALREEWIDRRALGTSNNDHAVKEKVDYDSSVATMNQDYAEARANDGYIDAAEENNVLARDRVNVDHDRDAHRKALESEAAWKSLLVGTIATVLVSVLTAGAGTGLVATVLLSAVTAGAGAAMANRIKEEILDVDFDSQDAVDNIRQEVYGAVVNAIGSHLAKQLLKLKSVKDKLAAVKKIFDGAPPWLLKAIGGAGESVLTDAITVALETGGAAVSGGDVRGILRDAPSRFGRAAVQGALQTLLLGEGPDVHKGWRPDLNLRHVLDGKSLAFDTVFSLLWDGGDAASALLRATSSRAVGLHGEFSERETPPATGTREDEAAAPKLLDAAPSPPTASRTHDDPHGTGFARGNNAGGPSLPDHAHVSGSKGASTEHTVAPEAAAHHLSIDDSSYFDPDYEPSAQAESGIQETLDRREEARRAKKDATEHIRKLAAELPATHAAPLIANYADATRAFHELLHKYGHSPEKLRLVLEIRAAQEKLRSAHERMKIASEELGARVTVDYMNDALREIRKGEPATLLHPGENDARVGGGKETFDFIYAVGDPPHTIIVVESKGGESELGTIEGGRVEQGSSPYLDTVAEQMKKKAQGPLLVALEAILARGEQNAPKVHYLHVKAQIRRGEVVGNVREFDARKKQPTKK